MIRRVIVPIFLFATCFAQAQTRTLVQGSNDLLFNPSLNVAYASVPSTTTAYPNRVIEINPTTGVVIRSLFVGSEPKRLAVSSDGTTLYVALDGAGMVRQIDTATFTSVRSWSLPVLDFYGQMFVEDIAVNPNNAQDVAISMYRKGISPRHGGVVYYRSGVKTQLETADHTGSNCIAFGLDAGKLYGYNNESTEFGFRSMTVSNDGVVENSKVDVDAGFNTTFKVEKARAYFTNGIIWDYRKAKLLGTIALPSNALDVAPDIKRNRVTFLVDTATGYKLYIYNLTAMTLVRTCPTNGKGSSYYEQLGGSLNRYGQRGIMFRSLGKIHFLPVVTGL